MPVGCELEVATVDALLDQVETGPHGNEVVDFCNQHQPVLKSLVDDTHGRATAKRLTGMKWLLADGHSLSQM